MLNKVICINIWDDYDEDESGETDARIEGEDNISENDRDAILNLVSEKILGYKLHDLTVTVEDGQLNFTGLNHLRREVLVDALNNADIKYGKRPLNFYSES